MGLRLSSVRLARLRAATEALLSPLHHQSIGDWAGETLRRVDALFEADRSMLMIPAGGELQMHSNSLPPEGLQALGSLVTSVEPGSLRSDDEEPDSVFRARSSTQLEVWHNEALARTAGLALNELPLYHEVMVPYGIVHGSGMVASLPLGEAWVTVAHSRADKDPFGVEGTTELLSLLLPALKAGASRVAGQWEITSSVSKLLDAAGRATAVWGLDGRERFRSQALCDLLAADPERERLSAAMEQIAAAAGGVRRAETKTAIAETPRPPAREITTAHAPYRVLATLLPAGLYGADPAVLVALERTAPALPEPRTLIARYGLTAREAEVALLLARGTSNRQIARRLEISPHTVRTHAERIFVKLGIHSRKALGLRLLGDETPRY